MSLAMVPLKIVINGYGRTARNVLRALYESGRMDEMRIVAINGLGVVDEFAHLTRYDTAHGRFLGAVTVDGGDLVVNGDHIKVLSEPDPARLPWAALGVDLVIESTGLLTRRDKAAVHLHAGAKKVLISAPAGNDVPAIVHVVNDDVLTAADRIVSNASCTTTRALPTVWRHWLNRCMRRWVWNTA